MFLFFNDFFRDRFGVANLIELKCILVRFYFGVVKNKGECRNRHFFMCLDFTLN